MARKRYDPDEAEFDAGYERWLAALESGDEAELLEATIAIPTLNSRVLDRFFAVESDDLERPGQRAMEQRLIVLLSELRPHEAARLRELHKARQRRLDRTTRIGRTVELPTKCARCGSKLKDVKPTGRPRIYCSPACRKGAYEDRRAHRDGAVKVQVIERVVTEVRERRIEIPHPRSECIRELFANDDALVNVIWALIEAVRGGQDPAFSPDQPRFWDLYNNVEVLYEAVVKRVASYEPPEHAEAVEETPGVATSVQRNVQRFTRKRPPGDTSVSAPVR
ncbi:MAG: hypothetical protein QM673_11530 [Gordonia sp. (in: high G+C Gram-positive bacteria)]